MKWMGVFSSLGMKLHLVSEKSWHYLLMSYVNRYMVLAVFFGLPELLTC